MINIQCFTTKWNIIYWNLKDDAVSLNATIFDGPMCNEFEKEDF